MKALLMHNLFLGAGARMARYIVNDAPLPMIRSAIAELRDGARLIIFPEGTRTSAPPVGPCAATAGVIAARAGVHDDAVFAGMTPLQWQRVIDVNLNGFYNVAQPLMLPMLRTRWGRIVAITSVAGQAGNRGQVNYAAAKGALHAAVKSLALECASRGVTVNAVAPGIIASDMSAGAFDADAIKRMVPMQRAGQPQEVADLVAFLASDRAAYISGQTIGVNGALYQ